MSATGANVRLATPTRTSATPAGVSRPSNQGVRLWLVVVLFSGGLFGYDQGVISGALRGIKARFSLGPLLIVVGTSWVTLGAPVGALAAGELADRMQVHGAERGCDVRPGLPHASAGAQHGHPGRRAVDRRRRGR